jgi:hypothetical protein
MIKKFKVKINWGQTKESTKTYEFETEKETRNE